MLKDGALVVTRQILEPVPVTMTFTVNVIQQVPFTEEFEVQVNGRIERRLRTVHKTRTVPEKRTATVLRSVPRSVTQIVAANAIKAFVVTKEGKLEPLDHGKLSDRLKTLSAVLIGDSAAIDSRHLELIKAGTVYLSLPPAGPANVRGPEQGHGEKIPLPKGAAKDDPTRHNPATLAVTLPADAALWIDDHKTLQTGTRRRFTTPPLSPGEGFLYQFRASWSHDGRTVTQTRQVTVRAGETATITFTNLTEGKR